MKRKLKRMAKRIIINEDVLKGVTLVVEGFRKVVLKAIKIPFAK